MMNPIEKSKETSINSTLLNIISPVGLEIKRNNIILGENTGKVYGIVKYPQDLEYGCLARISNILGTVCSINCTPIDSGILIENIFRSINRNRGVANSAKDPLTRSRAKKAPEG